MNKQYIQIKSKVNVYGDFIFLNDGQEFPFRESIVEYTNFEDFLYEMENHIYKDFAEDLEDKLKNIFNKISEHDCEFEIDNEDGNDFLTVEISLKNYNELLNEVKEKQNKLMNDFQYQINTILINDVC